MMAAGNCVLAMRGADVQQVGAIALNRPRAVGGNGRYLGMTTGSDD